MTHVSRILAVVDFSGRAYRAFEHALALSAGKGAEVVVLQVVPTTEPFDARRWERLALVAELRRRASQAGVDVTDAVAQGDPATVILSQAAARQADLIVMASRSTTTLDRLRATAIEERVVAGTAVPVLVVPGRRLPTAAGPFRNIAVAIDLKAGSQRTVHAAEDLASGSADRLTLLHVVPRLVSDPATGSPQVGITAWQDLLMRDDQEQLVQDASRRLQAAGRTSRPGTATVSSRVLLGKTTAEIVRGVDDVGADLLVVGAQKHGLLWRALFGSTAARLLRVVGIPVLAVPDARAAARDERAPAKIAA